MGETSGTAVDMVVEGVEEGEDMGIKDRRLLLRSRFQPLLRRIKLPYVSSSPSRSAVR